LALLKTSFQNQPKGTVATVSSSQSEGWAMASSLMVANWPWQTGRQPSATDNLRGYFFFGCETLKGEFATSSLA
jgi:hypothetical protein